MKLSNIFFLGVSAIAIAGMVFVGGGWWWLAFQWALYVSFWIGMLAYRREVHLR